MASDEKRPLKVFLCHASGDKPPVRDLYKRLSEEGVDAWLDKEKLLPGQDWRLEIPRAVQEADVVVVCLSNKSVTKEGYVKKEIKFALDIAEEKPEGAIFLIPARLEDCTVPERLSRWHWVDLYEENGFIQLLRSLKLRANAVGATVEPTSYEDSDKEVERRLDQLYTEGLAAFYTEDWDRAYHRFQSILSERPSHKNATEKLTESERQRNLAKLYAQSTDAYKSENWQLAIKTLEELSQKSSDYKDVAQLLKNARKQKQLKELYAEAKTLHTAQKWQAVVKVFEQISAIDPAYPDSDGLLPSAQKEVAELKRLAGLNDLYSHAVREIDAGQWYEARRLLESVHKSETGFLETEKLLKKVENEIVREEEKRKQNDQINTLHEQAHGLLRSKKWRNALEKMEQIRKLDEHFPDADGIAEKAQKELAREEQEAERQNKLAALYAEAVRLLKEEKYQEALDKWGEVRAVDPKYPDRQWVGRTAKKELAKQTKPVQLKPRFVMSKSLWLGIVGLVVVGVVITGLVLSGGNGQISLPTSISAPIKTIFSNPTATIAPNKTNTPRLATAVPAISVLAGSGYSDPTMYDNFTGSGIDTTLWNADQGLTNVVVRDGYLGLGTNILSAKRTAEVNITESYFVESRFQTAPGGGATMFVWFQDDLAVCQTYEIYSRIHLFCKVFIDDKENILSDQLISQESWNIVRIEIEPSPLRFTFSVNGIQIGSYETDNMNSRISFGLGSTCKDTNCYFDYVRMGAIEDDPTIYENFSNATYNGRFDTTKWAYDQHDKDGSAIQKDGVLVFTQSGIEKGQTLRANEYWTLKLTESVAFEANLKSDMTSDGFVTMALEGNVIESISCGLHSMSNAVAAHCWTPSGDPHIIVTHGTWHVVRIEINLVTNTITSYIDGKKLSEDRYTRSLKNSTLYLNIHVWAGTNRVESTRPMIGYVDNVRVYPLEYVNP
jgi:outer membrane protein assembly factor BamD (BamD/ComL family)